MKDPSIRGSGDTQDGGCGSGEGSGETHFIDARTRLDLKPISLPEIQCPEDMSQSPLHPLNPARTWEQEASVSWTYGEMITLRGRQRVEGCSEGNL